MSPALKAAMEINARWHECSDIKDLVRVGCPTDDEVAAIIERHVSNSKEE